MKTFLESVNRRVLVSGYPNQERFAQFVHSGYYKLKKDIPFQIGPFIRKIIILPKKLQFRIVRFSLRKKIILTIIFYTTVSCF